jgi:hypothetical protein
MYFLCVHFYLDSDDENNKFDSNIVLILKLGHYFSVGLCFSFVLRLFLYHRFSLVARQF